MTVTTTTVTTTVTTSSKQQQHGYARLWSHSSGKLKEPSVTDWFSRLIILLILISPRGSMSNFTGLRLQLGQCRGCDKGSFILPFLCLPARLPACRHRH